MKPTKNLPNDFGIIYNLFIYYIMANYIIKLYLVSTIFLILISLNSFVFADYRKDVDLEFLKQSDNADLEVLIKYLISDKDGNERFTELLTYNEKYKKHYPNHRKYWDLIAAEFQLYGGNSFMNIYRGDKGILYREILIDVIDEFDVIYDASMTTEEIEISLLAKILQDSLKNVDDRKIREENEEVRTCLIILKKLPSDAKLASAMRTCMKNLDFKYKIATNVAKLTAKKLGVNLTTKAILIKVIGRAGLLISLVMDVISISDPAYRVTVPSVIQIAYIRQKLAYIAYMRKSQKNNNYYKIMGYVVFLVLLIGGIIVFLNKRRRARIKSG